MQPINLPISSTTHSTTTYVHEYTPKSWEIALGVSLLVFGFLIIFLMGFCLLTGRCPFTKGCGLKRKNRRSPAENEFQSARNENSQIIHLSNLNENPPTAFMYNNPRAYVEVHSSTSFIPGSAQISSSPMNGWQFGPNFPNSQTSFPSYGFKIYNEQPPTYEMATLEPNALTSLHSNVNHGPGFTYSNNPAPPPYTGL